MKTEELKTGIELIAQERQEQIEKHGFDVSDDLYYSSNELVKAALFCLSPKFFEWPFEWSDKFREKILSKSEKERKIIAGAFIAAEIDRMNVNSNGRWINATERWPNMVDSFPIKYYKTGVIDSYYICDLSEKSKTTWDNISQYFEWFEKNNTSPINPL